MLGNVFGIGDCTNIPTSKTAAACGAELTVVVRKNLFQVMKGENPSSQVTKCVILILLSHYFLSV